MNAHFFNRRLFFRRAINEPAWIERSSNNILERCTLVNLCEVGARLTISDVYDLPEKFALHLTRGSNLGRQCRVIWQRDHEVGVEFLSKAPSRAHDCFRSGARKCGNIVYRLERSARSLSGAEPPNRVVILQFANMDAVKAWRDQGAQEVRRQWPSAMHWPTSQQ